MTEHRAVYVLIACIGYPIAIGLIVAALPVQAVLLAVTAPFDRNRVVAGRFLRLVGVLISMCFPPWRLRIEGRWPGPGPYVVVANHQSILDILMLSRLPREMKWVAKEELFKIPWVGWMLRMSGDIPIRRGDAESGGEALARAKEYLARGMSVMMFPEGMRSARGTLLPFKSGAFRLAVEAGVPVLPIAVHGTAEGMPKGGPWVRPCRAFARMLPPVEVPQGAESTVAARTIALRDEARRRIAAELPAERERAARGDTVRAQGQPDEAAPAPQGAPNDERGSAASTDLERAGGSGGARGRSPSAPPCRMTEIVLSYGSRPLPVRAPPGVRLRVLAPPSPPPVPDLRAALDAALAHPVGARPLAEVASSRTRVVVIASDASRDEPRLELFQAVRRALAAVPDDHLTLAIANGTHGPARLERLGLPEDLLRRHRIVNHDARDEASMVEMGRTSRGTRLRVNRCLAEADLIVSTGRVKPHCFAGWGGGAKGIFPGLGHDVDIRKNHELKADPASSLGQADGNPCREDIEEAVRRIGKLVPPAGLFLREGGTVIVAAECPEGTGPLQVVNEKIFDLGVRRYLPREYRLFLVSGMDEATVGRTYATFAPGVEWALERAREAAGQGTLDALVLPDAGDVVPRPLR